MMNALDPVTIGLGLLAAGVTCGLLVWLALRRAQRDQRDPLPTPTHPTNTNAPNPEAVIIVHSGGRVLYSNSTANAWLGISEGQRPDLERLARSTEPPESFLSLCAAEGQARLSLQGKYVEGTSYHVPYSGNGAMAVTLRRPQLTSLSGPTKEMSRDAIDILSELSRAMSASLDLETTLEAILTGIGRLIQSDLSEIVLWDPNTSSLTPYRYSSGPDGEHTLRRIQQGYNVGEGLTGKLIEQRQPLLITELNEYSDTLLVADAKEYPLKSYAGVPLLVAGEPIGTLELGALSPNNFRQEDLDLLDLLSGQAAFAIQNSLTHEHEQQRLAELSGLANLAQATGALNDPQNLYERLVKSIAPLLDVEIMGLLVYEENRRTLEGKIPFIGLPEQFTALYRSEIPPGSPAEEILLSQNTILSLDAAEDERFETLGLMALIQAAGVVNTALIPIPAGGRSLGYLQAANKSDGTTLTQDELRLMAIIAGQIGPIIENAHLVQDARRRARQAEAMHRISSLAGSGATLDEIMKFSILELGRFLGAEFGALFLLDRDLGLLNLHEGSAFGFNPGDAAMSSAISMEDPAFRSTSTGSLRSLVIPDLLMIESLPEYYAALIEDLPAARSIISVPLEVREAGIGELMLGSPQAGTLGPNEAQVVATAARQLAAAIERTSLYSQTDEGLRKQIDSVSGINRITRALAGAKDVQNTLEIVLSEALQLSKAEAGTVRMVSPSEGYDQAWKVTHQAGSITDNQLLEIEIEALNSQEAVSRNAIEDPDAFGFCEPILSALVVPLQLTGDVIGIITLESFRRGAFEAEQVKLVEGLSKQAASAIENARRLEDYQIKNSQLDEQVFLLRSLTEAMTPQGLDESIAMEMDVLAHEIREAADFNQVTVMVLEASSGTLKPAGQAGSPEGTANSFFTRIRIWDEFEGSIQPEFKIGPAYRIPSGWRRGTGGLDTPLDPQAGEWTSGDLLFIPLWNAKSQPVGLIGLEEARSLWPDQAFAKALLPFAERASRLVNRSHRLEELESGLADLGIEVGGDADQVERPQLSPAEASSVGQLAAFSQLNQRVRQMRATLDIAEVVNQQPDRPSVLWAFGQELLKRMELDLVLVADQSQNGPRLLHVMGTVPEGAKPQTLFGRRNPLRACFDTHETLLVTDVDNEPDWKDAPFLTALNVGAFVALPIVVNGKVEAALLAMHKAPLKSFGDDDRQIYHMLGAQVGIALQNLNLLTDTRRRLREVDLLLDFSRQLGSLDPNEILKTLVRSTLQVVGNAHAGMVALWDEQEGLLVPKAAYGYTDNELIKEITYRTGEALPGRVYAQGEALLVDDLDFADKYKLSSENLMRYREATGGRLPVSSMVIPLQTLGDPLGVVVLDNFNTTSAFNLEDQALVTSLAQQTALSLENASLFQAADERAAQLRSLTEIAATVTSSLQTDELISTLLDQFATLLPFDTGTLWLRLGNQLTIRAARGFDEAEGRVGLTANVEDSQLLHEMVTAGKPISVENTHADARFPALVEHPYLSWLGIPLISKGEVAGVIALEKAEPSFYSEEHIQIARTFAAQATVALENARLFEESLRRTVELDERSRRLDRLNLTSTELSKSLDPDYIMVFTISELQQALGADGVAAVLFDSDGKPQLQAENPARGEQLPRDLPDLPIFDRLKETLGIFSTSNVAREPDLADMEDFFLQREISALACLPMATGSELHGLVLVYSGRTERFPSIELELATTITNQAAIAFQNARQYEETRQFSFELERRVAERTHELESEHRRTEILLNIITELSASLDLDIIINRTLALINEITDAEQSTVMLVQPEEANFIFRASQGFTTKPLGGGQETWLKVDEGLAGWVIKNQQGVLIHDLSEDERWVARPEEEGEQHRSSIAVPLIAGAESLGTLMIFHREPGRFTNDMLDLVQAIAQQIAVSINNAQLYLLIRDQAERLGGMLRSQQVETTRSRAILESVAEGVLVTDSTGVITLFNQAGEEILGLDQDLIQEKALDEFTGLFGKAAHSWMETIRFWSTDPSSAQASEAFDEEIQLEDGRVVAVSLSPVILRDEFLGTVSIFHDITHQVEVDRLKSEFVATVSHELRTPMTSIKGYVEILLMGAAGELNEQQQRFLEIVRVNTERLNILVDDLLDISRIEAGKVNLSIQPLDIREITERVIKTIEQRANDDGKTLTIAFEPAVDLPRIMGDPGRVSQILNNLVDNAYNYTPDGGHIQVALIEVEEKVEVAVQDNGIGIAPEEQERVFERFYRGEDPLVLASAGTGLGLSIVRQLVEMHGGQIWLESTGVAGEGSTFFFSIPVYASTPEIEHKTEVLPEVTL